MHWKTIRLELARTPEFPRGSASRAHLLRLPVNDQGVIDEEALRAAPGRATVRRFWPNEPDMAGHVVRTVEGWAFSYSIGEKDELILHLESGPMRQGEQVTLIEPGGRRLPFRIASVEPNVRAASLG